MVQALSKLTVDIWLQQDMETLLNWINADRPSIDSLDPNLGLSLFDGLILRVDNLLLQGANQTSLQWSDVTLRLCDRLLQNAPLSLQATLMTKAMMLRVRLIKALGIQVNHPILDPKVIIQWFQKNCELSLVEAKENTQDWHNQPIEKIRQLRQLKNQLRVLVELNQIPQIHSNYPEIVPCLNLQSQLP